MDEFPMMLYRPGTEIAWEGMNLDTLVVDTIEARDEAMADGWSGPTGLSQPLASEPIDTEPRVKGRHRAAAADAVAA